MCGISGIVYSNQDRRCSEEHLLAMRDVMTHRGPDDKGIYNEGNVGLAHRRLSIIDLSSGHQPMATEDGGLVIVFNGEIYNYRELRVNLEQAGQVFKTNSDTEVILKSFVVYGKSCVEKLNGIFAFAIWNKASKSLFVARDHVGVKPLYYYNDSDTFVFASEVKSLFESGHVKPGCSLESVEEYFLYRCVAGEKSLFQDVNVLLPGHYMSIQHGKVVIEPYWNSLECEIFSDLQFEDAIENLSDLLTDAVKMQMMSDVPLGTFCSGGVDSSLVTAIAANNTDKQVNTFSVGFYEQEYDETKYARMVSDKYNTIHHELKIDQKQFTEYLPEMVRYNDEPLNFANSIHIYAISKLAKEYVTVVLTGEGADELFGGYPRYHIPSLVSRLQRLPLPIRKLASGLMNFSSDHRVAKLRKYMGMTLEDAIVFNSSQLKTGEYIKGLSDISARSINYRFELLQRMDKSSGILQKVSMLDQNSYMVSILNRQDKMSMAASIESRVPFLDHRLVSYANSVPASLKVKGTETKYLLKKFAERYLPLDVIYRRKSGFGVPLPIWIRQDAEFGKLTQEILTDAKVKELQQEVDIAKLLTEHRSGVKDHSEFLWTTLNFLLWKNAFGIQ